MAESVQTNPPVLYTGATGKPRSQVSYSSASDYRTCPRLFQLKKIVGWAERRQSASMKLGIAVENAIQYYHENGEKDGSGPRRFEFEWDKFRELPLEYSDKEDSWATCLQIGKEMLALYEISWRKWFREPRFQLQYKKEIFPDTELAGIEHVAYIDILAQNDAGAIIVDAKVYAQGMKAWKPKMDPQLREYSWQSGISQVAFLVFVKNGLALEPGSWVTVLAGPWTGRKVRILSDDEQGNYFVVPAETWDQYDLEKKEIKGASKAAKEAKQNLLNKYIDAASVMLSGAAITKQSIQFLPAIITQEEREAAGNRIGKTVLEMLAARESGDYPQEPLVRFPDKCGICAMLPICIGDDQKRDETLYQIGALPEYVQPDLEEEL
jgi:hypothetical protein